MIPISKCFVRSQKMLKFVEIDDAHDDNDADNDADGADDADDDDDAADDVYDDDDADSNDVKRRE